MVNKLKKDGNLIFFGESVYVEEIIGLSPDEFLKIFECLQNGGLKINQIYYPIEKVFLNNNVKSNNCIPVINEILEFIFLCNELKRRNIKISKLLREFTKSQKEGIDSIRHDVTVARICYEYIKKGYRVELFPKYKNNKKPDLKINELYSDIKMKQEEWIIKLLEYRQDIESKIGTIYAYKPNEVRKKDIGSKAEGWFTNLDVIFYDISYAITEGGFGRLCDSRTQLKPIDPIKNKVIICSYSKSCNLHNPNISWSYWDWDPINRELI